jgi:hypothetical protein
LGNAGLGEAGFGEPGLVEAGLVETGLAVALGFAATFGRCDFNGSDAPRCDVLAAPRTGLAAFAGRFFAAGLLAAVLDPARAGAAAAALEGVLSFFFCVFLDIRLPFVAFGGSIIGHRKRYPDKFESSRPLGKSDGPGVRLQGIRRITVRSLNGLPGMWFLGRLAGNGINRMVGSDAGTEARVE